MSIVTPSFNQARFLEETLRSILDQDYPRFECIVVDGGSTDGSLEIIQRYAARLAHWVSEADLGRLYRSRINSMPHPIKLLNTRISATPAKRQLDGHSPEGRRSLHRGSDEFMSLKQIREVLLARTEEIHRSRASNSVLSYLISSRASGINVLSICSSSQRAVPTYCSSYAACFCTIHNLSSPLSSAFSDRVAIINASLFCMKRELFSSIILA